MLSNRIEQLGVSPIRKYNALASAAEARGTKILKLNIGQPDIETPDLFFEALKEYPSKHVPYSNSQGTDEMLAAQKEYYQQCGLEFSESEIFVTVGAMEGIEFALLALCDPGDGVLLIAPFYSNYKLALDLYNIEIHEVTTHIEDNYAIPSVEEMKKSVKENTKAILLANPGNPTGRVYTQEEVDRIAQLAKERDLIIIADEVYREFNYTDRAFVSFGDIRELEEHVILIDSASKKYSACGSRIGTVATKNKEISGAIMKLCQKRLSAPTVDMYAIAALINLEDDYFDKVAHIYNERRLHLQKALEAVPDLTFSKPEGAFYTIVALPLEDADDFVIWMLNEFEDNGEVLLPTPAEGFYESEGSGKNEVRISYCVDEKILVRAVEILDKALDAYPKSFRNKNK